MNSTSHYRIGTYTQYGPEWHAECNYFLSNAEQPSTARRQQLLLNRKRFEKGTQIMFKRILIVAALGVAGFCTTADNADAGIFFRPVRRVVARTVLPPYPVARTVLPPYPVARTVLSPVVHPGYVTPIYGAPVYGPVTYGYGAPYMYGGGVSVVVGY
jgi:hypothetical protein